MRVGPDPDSGPCSIGECGARKQAQPSPQLIASSLSPGTWDDRRDRVMGGETRVRVLFTYSQIDASPGFLKEMLGQDLIAKSLL